MCLIQGNIPTFRHCLAQFLQKKWILKKAIRSALLWGEKREGELQVQSRRLLEISLVDPSQLSGTIPSHESTSSSPLWHTKGIIISPTVVAQIWRRCYCLSILYLYSTILDYYTIFYLRIGENDNRKQYVVKQPYGHHLCVLMLICKWLAYI